MPHGGDRYRNQVRYDFSVNLNPLGMPEVLKEAMLRGIDTAGCYPDPLQERECRDAAHFYGVRAGIDLSPREVIPGNGASELISAVFHALNPGRILLPVPCFTGYVRAAGRDCRIDTCPSDFSTGYAPSEMLGTCIRPDTGLLILTNPGNPGGGMIPRKLLLQLLQITRERKIPVLLDECCMEFTGREEESGLLLVRDFPNLMVLRAFTKIFAMPGLRLGMLFTADPVLQEKIRRALPEWNLSSFAGEVVHAAALETQALDAFIRRTASETARLRARTEELLRSLGAETAPSDANFVTARGLGNSCDKLLQRGILVRSCEDMNLPPDHIRIAVRPEPEQDQLYVILSNPVILSEAKDPFDHHVILSEAKDPSDPRCHPERSEGSLGPQEAKGFFGLRPQNDKQTPVILSEAKDPFDPQETKGFFGLRPQNDKQGLIMTSKAPE